jgi:hypothetical protein
VAELVWLPATTHPAGYLAAVDRYLTAADAQAGSTQVTQKWTPRKSVNRTRGVTC